MCVFSIRSSIVLRFFNLDNVDRILQNIFVSVPKNCFFFFLGWIIPLNSRIYFSACKSALRQIIQRCPSLTKVWSVNSLKVMKDDDSGGWLFRRKTRPLLIYTAFVLNPPEAAHVQVSLDIKEPILSHEAQTIKHVMQCTVQLVWLWIVQARSSPWLLYISLCHSY